MAGWQSGHAAACKAAHSGSIPLSASIAEKEKRLIGAFSLSEVRTFNC
jgi:hypothetical protein